jgi:4-alpha-glucanotransferase
VRIRYEDGSVADLSTRPAKDGVILPPIAQPGYHVLEIGQDRVTLAVAPAQCITIADLAPRERLWGLAVQIYGLRSCGDCGIGDMAGVLALAKSAASLRADALALSPVHALFAADPSRFSPYSPSSRLFYNPLHADPAALFDEASVASAQSQTAADLKCALDDAAFIDWERSGRAKMAVFGRLFDNFLGAANAANTNAALQQDFAQFRTTHATSLAQHALFETLHAARLRADAQDWRWSNWPAEWRDPHSPAVKNFAAHNEREILFHSFLQWISARSLAAAQRQATDAGMRIGLIADLAVGMDDSGSATWSAQQDMLTGLHIGAPPDLFNNAGQDWGLTTLSPRALSARGFAPFVDTLRASMQHAGGLRIDHVMGLMRLWVIPDGAKAGEGAYLTYPLDDLLRLVALESHRHRAVVIGEDLGTVPVGFRERLVAASIYGMNVLWFERGPDGFAPPPSWPVNVAAMTSTHDLPTVVGWWRGRDIEVRGESGLVGSHEQQQELAARDNERQELWSAFRAAKVAAGEPPPAEDGQRVDDAATKFVASTPSRLLLLPIEDALGLDDQPNVPGTIDQQPNWRRRYRGKASELLSSSDVIERVKPLLARKEL